MDIKESDQMAIRSVIAKQIQAFQNNNGAGAYAIAAPNIQQQFGSVERFMRMVKTAYRPVYCPRSVIFEALTWIQSRPAQQVILLGDDDQLYRAFYLMERVKGDWRIGGCYLVTVEGN